MLKVSIGVSMDTEADAQERPWEELPAPALKVTQQQQQQQQQIRTKVAVRAHRGSAQRVAVLDSCLIAHDAG